ncbi:hypothetical protein ES703_43646 [subsurface metagenome]
MSRSESKKDAFRRLATQRTNNVLDRLRVLGHCANPQLYEYSEEDVKRMFKAIDTELRAVRFKFQNSSRSQFQL